VGLEVLDYNSKLRLVSRRALLLESVWFWILVTGTGVLKTFTLIILTPFATLFNFGVLKLDLTWLCFSLVAIFSYWTGLRGQVQLQSKFRETQRLQFPPRG
jgi:hypothetical protein